MSYNEFIMLNTFIHCQNLAKPNGLGDIHEKLLLMSDIFVQFLVTTSFSTDKKSPDDG